MKVLLVCASNSLVSINGRVMDVVSKMGVAESLYLTKHLDIPLLNRDFYESEGVPKGVREIYDLMRNFGRIVFFAPENNGYLSSFFKNILDWLSLIEIGFLRDMDVVLVSVSTTAKEIRYMEEAVAKTFALFHPKSYEFFNFRNYGTEEDGRNLSLLAERIFADKKIIQ